MKTNEVNKYKNYSKIYYKAIDNIYNKEIESIASLEDISRSSYGFGLLAKMKLIKIYVNNKEYENAYKSYQEIIENDVLDSIYKDLIILHACYNLFDNVNYKKISILLNYTDIDKSIFKSHLKEIYYINSIIS